MMQVSNYLDVPTTSAAIAATGATSLSRWIGRGRYLLGICRRRPWTSHPVECSFQRRTSDCRQWVWICIVSVQNTGAQQTVQRLRNTADHLTAGRHNSGCCCPCAREKLRRWGGLRSVRIRRWRFPKCRRPDDERRSELTRDLRIERAQTGGRWVTAKDSDRCIVKVNRSTELY